MRCSLCTADSGGGGVAIAANGGAGKFTMNGGTIKGCKAQSSKGGAVFVDTNAIFDMYAGAKISDCTADSGGGGVAISGNPVSGGKFTMNGGTITLCKATQSSKDGGGVLVDSMMFAQFIMNGGIISDCQASNDGGGVALLVFGSNPSKPAFTMHAGSITGCRAQRYGGGISYPDARGSYIIIDGGTITNCTADVQGGGVYFAGVKFIMNSTAVAGPSGNIRGNTGSNVYRGTVSPPEPGAFEGTAANVSTYSGMSPLRCCGR